MAANDNATDPRAVAAALDELVEEAFGIVSRAIDPGGGLSEHQAINALARLFESGAGWEARRAAELMFRPPKRRPQS